MTQELNNVKERLEEKVETIIFQPEDVKVSTKVEEKAGKFVGSAMKETLKGIFTPQNVAIAIGGVALTVIAIAGGKQAGKVAISAFKTWQKNKTQRKTIGAIQNAAKVGYKQLTKNNKIAWKNHTKIVKEILKNK